MKRLGVMAIYQNDKELHPYLEYLIDSLCDVISEIVFIVNGDLNSWSKNKLQRIGKVYCRDNIGFDAGAYKYYFAFKANWNEIGKYDEIVLLNDTFCGPFIPWKQIFDSMHREKFDFWGLSRWVGGFSEVVGRELPEHIQSYFVVFTKTVIESEAFYEFWDRLVPPLDYGEAICNFEVFLTSFFLSKKFSYGTWIDNCKADHLYVPGEVVYISSPSELIVDYSFPILKKKSCIARNLGGLVNILKFNENEKINIVIKEYITEHLKKISGINLDSIEEFIISHNRVYLYGNGLYSRNLRMYLDYKGLFYYGIICTDVDEELSIYRIKDVILDKLDGIIIATEVKYYPAIRDNIKKYYPHIDIMEMCH